MKLITSIASDNKGHNRDVVVVGQGWRPLDTSIQIPNKPGRIKDFSLRKDAIKALREPNCSTLTFVLTGEVRNNNNPKAREASVLLGYPDQRETDSKKSIWPRKEFVPYIELTSSTSVAPKKKQSISGKTSGEKRKSDAEMPIPLQVVPESVLRAVVDAPEIPRAQRSKKAKLSGRASLVEAGACGEVAKRLEAKTGKKPIVTRRRGTFLDSFYEHRNFLGNDENYLIHDIPEGS